MLKLREITLDKKQLFLRSSQEPYLAAKIIYEEVFIYNCDHCSSINKL